jgi:hypothetical protein
MVEANKHQILALWHTPTRQKFEKLFSQLEQKVPKIAVHFFFLLILVLLLLLLL